MDTLFVILAFIQIYVFAYSVAFNVEKVAKWQFLQGYPFVVKTTVRTCLGVVLLVPILYVVSLVAVSTSASLSLFVASLLATAVLSEGTVRKLPSLGRKILGSRVEMVAVVIGLVTVGYFARSVSASQWPPVGDITWVHGPMVSLISYYGRLPDSWFPITNLPLHYPAGFHVGPAFLNAIWNVYPGQAVFIYGASLIGLLTLLIYSLTWMLTESTFASLAGAISVLYVFPTDLHLWTLGYFYSGPYPNLIAFLFVTLFATVLLIEDKGGVSERRSPHMLPIGAACSLALLLSYPPFLIYPALGTLAALFLVRRNSLVKLWTTLFQARSTIILGILVLAVALLRPSWSASWTLGYLLAHPAHYALPFEELVVIWFGLSIIIGVGISLIHIRAGNFKRFPIQYLLVALPGLLFYVLPFLLVILPNRTLSLAFLIAPVLVLSISRLMPRVVAQRGIKIRKTHLTLGVHIVPIILLILSVPSIQLYATGNLDRDRFWFSRTSSFDDDFRTMQWMADNVPSRDLILNDLSYASLYLPSVKVLNATFSPIAANGETGNNREELFEVWRNPQGFFPPAALDLITPWNPESPWSNGQIGQPVLSEIDGELRITVPTGVFGQWGVQNRFSVTQNLSKFSAISLEVTSNGQLGLSLGLDDSNGRTARYDLTTAGTVNETAILSLDNPDGIDQEFDLSHVSRMTMRTGYASRFPVPGDELTISNISGVKSGVVEELLRKYDVQYLWISAEWGMIELSSFQGIPKYTAKPLPPSEYVVIFQSYPFLSRVYSSGNSVVFKVNIEQTD